MSIYRIYSTFKGLHILDKKETVEEVISCIERVIYDEENAHYLVVETNKEQNTDIPFVSIWSIDEFIEFKNEYFKKPKPFVKRKEKNDYNEYY